MSQQIQSIAAFAIVAGAAAWLVVRYLAGRKKPGCGGGCGCPSSDLRSKLRGR